MFAELLGFPSGELGSAVISRIDANSGNYYENAYPLSASLRTEYQNKNPNSFAGSDLFCQSHIH